MGSISKAVIALCGVLTAAYLLQPYRPVIVRGVSMEPTFRDGQLVFSVPMQREPKVGDVVLVDVDGTTMIKRVTMVPGDEYLEAWPRHAAGWSLVTTGGVKRLIARGVVPSRTRVVPAGQMFVEGDNPSNSLDSRSFGLVPVSSIRGLVTPLV